MSDIRSFLNGRVQLHAGDCLAILPTLAENSVDSCVVDPPYHLTGVKGGGSGAVNSHNRGQTSSPFAAKAGFMGKQWDGGDVAFRPETWAAVLRVLKPGGHLVAFAAPKNAHRMVCAIEDAGFEIRDTLMWLFGSGFPKSLSVGKAIDKADGAEREVIGEGAFASRRPRAGNGATIHMPAGDPITVPATDAARQWEGWGSALKPAYEPICLARKPLSEPTIAANVLRWGTGALNIDGCLVGTSKNVPASVSRKQPANCYGKFAEYGETQGVGGHDPNVGRWPANVIHDGSEEVVGAFPETSSGELRSGHAAGNTFGIGNDTKKPRAISGSYGNDSGSAARFFYTAKADSDDRLGSKHPTVKPLDLIQYLCRLITPPKGTILDCFAGTGTTGEAAWREGFSAILIEREPEYLADIERRMSLALSGPDERARESIKARLKGKPVDAGPLFGGRHDMPNLGRTIGPTGLKL